MSCAVPGALPNEASTAGKAGRYMSVAAGPTAIRKPSRVGSQRAIGTVGVGGMPYRRPPGQRGPSRSMTSGRRVNRFSAVCFNCCCQCADARP